MPIGFHDDGLFFDGTQKYANVEYNPDAIDPDRIPTNDTGIRDDCFFCLGPCKFAPGVHYMSNARIYDLTDDHMNRMSNALFEAACAAVDEFMETNDRTRMEQVHHQHSMWYTRVFLPYHNAKHQR